MSDGITMVPETSTKDSNEVTWQIFWITTGILTVIVIFLLIATIFLLCQYCRNRRRPANQQTTEQQSTVLSNMYTEQNRRRSSRFDGPNEMNYPEDYDDVGQQPRFYPDMSNNTQPSRIYRPNQPFPEKMPHPAPRNSVPETNIDDQSNLPPPPGPKPDHMRPSQSEPPSSPTNTQNSPSEHSSDGYENESNYDDTGTPGDNNNYYETTIIPNEQPVYDEVAAENEAYENSERLV
uniref:uncharacterized protein LOC120329998 n=1 Tax=Styela clava TaxID=7725 RepID=UPI00193AD893|nr:uncharacterized protein LOC120329998 [Styela clava]